MKFTPPVVTTGRPNIQLLIIDPQNDFCRPGGALYVQGAQDDMQRAAAMIDRLGSKITKISVTLDSHHLLDVAHPLWWRNSAGEMPEPLKTSISSRDIEQGVWTTFSPALLSRTLAYTKALESGGRYPLVVWPPHCLIGSEGAQVHGELFKSLLGYEERHRRSVNYVTKGSNPWTEHYSAVKAEVPDPEDPGTLLNSSLISTLQQADVIAILGEALDYCVANTLRDIMAVFGDENIRKMVLITDCTSAVGFPAGLAQNFMDEFIARGGKVSTSAEFYA